MLKKIFFFLIIVYTFCSRNVSVRLARYLGSYAIIFSSVVNHCQQVGTSRQITFSTKTGAKFDFQFPEEKKNNNIRIKLFDVISTHIFCI